MAVVLHMIFANAFLNKNDVDVLSELQLNSFKLQSVSIGLNNDMAPV